MNSVLFSFCFKSCAYDICVMGMSDVLICSPKQQLYCPYPLVI